MADPRIIAADYRTHLELVFVGRERENASPLPGLATIEDVRSWTLYGARHGEIMTLLIAGVAVELEAAANAP